MKVLNSLRTAKERHPDCQIVKRKGRLYVICKSNPRFKAVQGRKKKRGFKIRRINDICLINNQTGLMLVYLLHQH